MGKIDVVVGLQYGDEGKGKVVDTIASNYDIVARFNGGPNAGHTIYRNGKKYVLHSIPSGILNKGTHNYIGNGCVVDIDGLIAEYTALKQDPDLVGTLGSLIVSEDAHVILPSYVEEDKNDSLTKSVVKTTGKGIGPTYYNKYKRTGVKVKDFRDKLRNTGIIVERSDYIRRHVEDNFSVLAEGAQGYGLDIDLGNYPYVTSSNTTSAAACVGLGVSPREIRHVIGVCKVYETKVGGGPLRFPYSKEMQEKIRTLGNEYGATTGRPRDIGALDVVLLEDAIKVNGCNIVCMMKADVIVGIDGLEAGTRPLRTPLPLPVIKEVSPSDTGLSSYKYFVGKRFGVPVVCVSSGPNKDDWLNSPLAYV